MRSAIARLPNKARLVLLRRLPSPEEPVSAAIAVSNGVAVEELTADQTGLQTRFPPSDFRFSWATPPRTVLIVQKPGGTSQRSVLLQITQWLWERFGMNVVVEHDTLAASHEKDFPHEAVVPFHPRSSADLEQLTRTVDLIVALGGDGTLLHVSSLFKTHVPPVVCFSMGTLGFLMQFAVHEYQSVLTGALEGQFSFVPRMRLSCATIAADGKNIAEYQIMNEVVIHRAYEPHLASIDVFINNELMTNALADGIIIATPTGSTAYSLSAGGSVVHPSVKGILLTPICPRSLSFRPAFFSPDAEFILQPSSKGRGNTTASLDGRDVSVLRPGEHIRTRASLYSVPTVTRAPSHTTDWVRDINRLLKWNVPWSSR